MVPISAEQLEYCKSNFDRTKSNFRGLTGIYHALTKDIPDIFSGTVEMHETFLGGQWKQKRKIVRNVGTKRGKGNTVTVKGII